MSLETKKKEYQDFKEIGEEEFDIKSLVLSFAFFPETQKVEEEYIYTGEEKISFSKRHPVYRALFLNEFSEHLKSK